MKIASVNIHSKKLLPLILVSSLLFANNALALDVNKYSSVAIFGNVAPINASINGGYGSRTYLSITGGQMNSQCQYVQSTFENRTEANQNCTTEQLIQEMSPRLLNSSYSNGMNLCATNYSEYCVKSLEFIYPDGTIKNATLDSVIVEGQVWSGHPEIGLPPSSPLKSIWKVGFGDNASNYLLKIQSIHIYQKLATGEISPKFFKQIYVDLVPFEKADPNLLQKWSTPPRTAYTATPYKVKDRVCPVTSVWHTDTDCFMRTDFPSDIKINLKLQIPQQSLGSIVGRFMNPDLNIQDSGAIRNLTFSASPIQIPGVYVDNLTKAGRYININNNGYHAGIKSTIDSLKNYANDQANASRTDWSFFLFPQIKFWFTTLRDEARFNSCEASRIKSGGTFGTFLTTNAFMSSGDAPTYKGKELQYKLTGLHANTDGKTFKGFYQMVMDADFMRCFYQLKNKALQAKVSITDDNGKAQTAFTQSLKEDTKSKKIYLTLAGFHFSDPTISMQLTN